MEFFNGGCLTGEGASDAGKARFQQELSRWFESRGVVAELRSHLRHLMVTALQNGHLGPKPADRSSPKAQALNLLVAEYLFRHRCHYTLSVFTSEMPALADFSLDRGLQGGKNKRPHKNYFQEDEVEEILAALGMSSGAEELALLKKRYLEKGGEVSLVELFLQLTLRLATRLQVRHSLESRSADGERVLSEEWSSKVADVLLAEKVAPSRVSSVEEAIFRITENEVKRTAEEERRGQMEMLSMREKRIQEYLRKHEEELLVRLSEAEEELRTRKDMIEEELSQREKHLTKMALEWGSKHEEILNMSNKFYNIENENKTYKKKLKEMEEENRRLRAEGESQKTTIDDLREELNSLMSKLKEATASKAALGERLQTQIAREAKDQDDANQTFVREEIPLLWPKNMDFDPDSNFQHREDSGPKIKPTAKKEKVPQQEQWNEVEPPKAFPDPDESESSEDYSLSSSFADIIQGVQQKLQFLEEESNRLNTNYLEYKLKCNSADSDSESSSPDSVKSPSPAPDEACITETKFCQTNIDDTFIKLQKLKGRKEEKYEFDRVLYRDVPEKLSPKKAIPRTPTKRQLLNRDFFLKSRHLVQEFEKRQTEELQTSLSVPSSSPSSSGEDLTSSREASLKSPIKSVALTPLKTLSENPNETLEAKKEPPAAADFRKALVESPKMVKSDADCLALLEETRIKSPQLSARMPLRQQMLLSESEKEEVEDEKVIPKSVVVSPLSNSSGRISVGRKSGNGGFW